MPPPANPLRPRPAVSLWQQLIEVARFVGAVRSGRSADDALELLPAQHRPAAQAIGFAVLRNLGLAQALLDLLAQRKPDTPTSHLLLSALALLTPSCDPTGPSYDPHTLINQTVEACKRQAATTHGAGFVNACLRRYLREADRLLLQAQQIEGARWNHPPWWLDRLKSDHPGHWEQVATADLCKAPLVLRIHPALLQTARQNLPPGVQVGPQAWAVSRPVQPTEIAGFSNGRISVQDSAAQLAAPLLLEPLMKSRARRLRILDACAAPGGKTTHLIELAHSWGMAIDVTALEIDAARAQRIHENLQRCGTQAQVLVADAARPNTWWDGQHFDGILLDAPCSASGIVRRHPDILWLRRPEDISRLAVIQSSLLDALWPMLAPQGCFVYCTCSVFRQEGSGQIEAFLSRNSQALLRPSPGHLLPATSGPASTLPDNQTGVLPAEITPPWQQTREHDGFFYAVLEHGAHRS